LDSEDLRQFSVACGHCAPAHRFCKHGVRRGKTPRRPHSINSGRSGQAWPLASEAGEGVLSPDAYHADSYRLLNRYAAALITSADGLTIVGGGVVPSGSGR